MPRRKDGVERNAVIAPMAVRLRAMPCFVLGAGSSVCFRRKVSASNSSESSLKRPEISRRDFVQGRFWGALGFRRKTVIRSDAYKPPLVMRYPKTIEDVASGNPQVSSSEAELHRDSKPAPATSGSSLPEASPLARRRTIPVFRPPGAIDEASFLANCTRCNKCVQVCPHTAIVLAPIRLREAAGTPIIDPDSQPCLMCADFPCITVCEPQVLTHSIPKLMGTARITAQTCLAYNGTTCTVCHERCPVPEAIQVSSGKPTIDENACTGCGVCRYVCPSPENAILLMPIFSRPSIGT